VSTLDNVFAIFQTLCGCKLEAVLPLMIDRWEVEINKVAKKPIIANYKKACADIGAIFDIRHVICHEAPELRRLDLSKLIEQLHSLTEFSSALDWYLVGMLHGNIPLTQTDMTINATRKYKEADEEMKAVLRTLEEKFSGDPRQLELLNATQVAWEQFKDVQSLFRHDPEGGGTIGPMLRASEAEELTRERVKHLLWYATRKEGDM
jgi:uncharacterized protein YecT (DUF1311 family)